MKSLLAGACCALVCLLARTAAAQTPTPPAGAASQPVRVFLTCDGCDAALKAAATFVEYVTDPQLATLEVVIEAKAPEGDTRTWQFTYTGRSTFTGQDRRLSLSLPATASAEEIRAGLVRVFKFGLVEYALRSDSGQHLDVSFAAPETAGQAAAPGTPVHDPWNYWVFRVGMSTDGYGEVSQASRYYSGSVSANRTTEEWKIRLSGYKSGSTSRFEVSDEETVRTNERQWNLDSLVVKSLGEHWSAGFTSTLNSSTYSNQRLTANFSPAVEYDVFPYSESSQRSLTIQYTAGIWHYRYGELTIYDRLSETMPQHSVTASLGLRQPWGTAGVAAVFSQVLNAPEFNRQSVDGSFNIRIFKGFTVNAGVSFSRIRDQFFLEKRGASDEEVLLRLRQLATGHRYSINFGLSYSFGSLSNATVNPRFGS